jgi:FtsP/CotA-like multicopper oxidase with cupredoxin domain
MQPSLALGALLVLLGTTTAQVVDVTLTSAESTVDLGPGYAAEPAMLYNGQLPGPVLRITEGQTLRVRYRNQLQSEDSIVHWHGQPVQLGMDGAAGISRPSTAPGQEFRYVLEGLKPGTYWYHPHSENHHHQIDRGLYGVLIVDPSNTANEPQSDIDQVIVLDDWLAPGGSAFSGYLLNGRTSSGQAPIQVTAGQRLRLRFVNTSFRSNFTVALDGHPMTVTHSDGYRLQNVVTDALPIGIGERYDVIVDCNNPGVWSLAVSLVQNRNSTVVRGIVRYAGQTAADPAAGYVPSNLSSGSLLSYSQLASFDPSPITAAPQVQAPMVLTMQMGSGGQQFLINGEAWPVVTPLAVAFGDVVQMDYSSNMMGGMGWHPMHVHGHSFRLMGTAGGTTHAPIKDIVLLRPMGQAWSTASVQFNADNPGRWLSHCHDMMHMMNGMMTAIDYTGDADADGIPDNVDMEPLSTTPVLTIAEDAAAFAPGGFGALGMQWQTGEACTVFASLFEQPAQAFPPYGDLLLAAANPIGSLFVGASHQGSLPYAIPADPSLSGFTLHLQALCNTSLTGGVRLSTHQPFSIR